MSSCSSTSTYPSTGTPKLKLKITKEDKKLTVQVLEQDERFRSKPDDDGFYFDSSNGFEVKSRWSPILGAHDEGVIELRGEYAENHLNAATCYFGSNAERDAYLARMEEALRDWAENAPEFQTDPDSTDGRIVTFKSDKAEVEFVKFEKALAMQVKSMDERFREANSRLSYESTNGIRIRSYFQPDLYLDSVDLLGRDKARDAAVSHLLFISDADRDAYLAKALAALDDWSKNYEAWKAPEPTCPRDHAAPCGCACHGCHCENVCYGHNCRHNCIHDCGKSCGKDEYIFTV